VSLVRAAALAADGRAVLIANPGTHQVLRWADGGLSVFAGDGTPGDGGDGGPAARAQLRDPSGLAVDASGTVYIADAGNGTVRAVSPDGVVTRVAGTGGAGAGTGLALSVPVGQPTSVAAHGTDVYIVDDAGVQRLAGGRLATVIPAGAGAVTIDGEQTAFYPDAVAVGADGHLFVANSSPKQLIEAATTGAVVRHWDTYVTPAGLATAPDGAIVVGDYGAFAVGAITGGVLHQRTAFALGAVPGVNGAFRPSGVTVASDGTVYATTDGVNGGTDRSALVRIERDGAVHLLASGPAPCTASQLRLSVGSAVSEPTGQHSLSLVLANASATTCTLEGYPTITLVDHVGAVLPFTYADRGDQVVTGAMPAPVMFPPGGSGYVTVNSYRCDLGDRGIAAELALTTPDGDGPLRVAVTDHPLAYCGPGDPGSTVSVSPVEPSFGATLGG